MFEVKRKNNPAIIYTVLSVVYAHGEALFLIYNTINQFELVRASEFDLVSYAKGAIKIKEDINAN